MEIFKNTNFDFLGKKWPFIIASLVLTAAGLASLVAKGGPRYGIDFAGGTVTTVRFASAPNEDKIRAVLGPKIPGEIIVQQFTGSNEVMITTELRDESELNAARTVIENTLAENFGGKQGDKLDFNNASTGRLAEALRTPLAASGASFSEEQLAELSRNIIDFRNGAPRSGLLGNYDDLRGVSGVTDAVINALKSSTFLGGYNIRSFDLVGPKVGAELRTQAINATLLALLGMLLYLAFRFEWMYGLAAVIAVFHDVIITIGLFSIANKEISLTVIAALLTLVGFSMNDTIVVFDRIRENLPLRRKDSFAQVVNDSINQTLSRTIMTSGLTFLTAMALWLFGGQVLNGFSFALVMGIIVGTYSSIFVASPILIWLKDWWESRKPPQTAEAAAAVKSAPSKTRVAGKA